MPTAREHKTGKSAAQRKETLGRLGALLKRVEDDLRANEETVEKCRVYDMQLRVWRE